jgi:hypothetical protein
MTPFWASFTLTLADLVGLPFGGARYLAQRQRWIDAHHGLATASLSSEPLELMRIGVDCQDVRHISKAATKAAML